jgi:hypothetical protein
VTVVGYDQEFIDWVLETCKEVRKTAEDEHILNVFWNDVVVLYDRGRIDDRHVNLRHDKVSEKDYLAIWFPPVFNEWAKEYRQRTGQEPFDKASIIQYIKDEPYFEEYKNIRLDSQPRKCYVLDPDLGPDYLNELLTSVNEKFKA